MNNYTPVIGDLEKAQSIIEAKINKFYGGTNYYMGKLVT